MTSAKFKCQKKHYCAVACRGCGIFHPQSGVSGFPAIIFCATTLTACGFLEAVMHKIDLGEIGLYDSPRIVLR